MYGSTSFVPLLKGREQQDAVTGLERDLDRAHLLAHVLRHALDGAAPQVGEQLRTGIVRDRDTAAHARAHIGGDLLHGIEFFRPRHGNTLVAVRVIDRQIDRNDRPAVLDSADLDRQPFTVDPRRPRYGRTRGDEQISRHHRFQQPESNLPAIGERHGLLHGGTDTVALGLAKVAPHRSGA